MSCRIKSSQEKKKISPPPTHTHTHTHTQNAEERGKKFKVQRFKFWSSKRRTCSIYPTRKKRHTENYVGQIDVHWQRRQNLVLNYSRILISKSHLQHKTL